MARAYYSVVSKTPDEGSKWEMQFGDYDKETVQEEMQDMKDHVGDGCTWEKGTKFKIIQTGSRKNDIEEALAKINSKEGHVK